MAENISIAEAIKLHNQIIKEMQQREQEALELDCIDNESDEIKLLRARVAELEEALKPFADAAEFFVIFPKAFGHKPRYDAALKDYENASMLSAPYKTNPISTIRVRHLMDAHRVIKGEDSR